MSSYGTISPFNSTDDFGEYYERVEQYFVAIKIDDDGQKTVIFITVIGDETYSLLRSFLAPTNPHTKSSGELAKVLIDHLTPKTIVIAERFRFYDRSQREGESISGCLAGTRKLSIH